MLYRVYLKKYIKAYQNKAFCKINKFKKKHFLNSQTNYKCIFNKLQLHIHFKCCID